MLATPGRVFLGKCRVRGIDDRQVRDARSQGPHPEQGLADRRDECQVSVSEQGRVGVRGDLGELTIFYIHLGTDAESMPPPPPGTT